MPTTKQTIAQWPFERLYVAPFTQKRGFDERSLTYRMVPIEQARQLTGIKVLDMVVDRLIKGPGPKKNPRYRGYTDAKLSATIHKLSGLTLPRAAHALAHADGARPAALHRPAAPGGDEPRLHLYAHLQPHRPPLVGRLAAAHAHPGPQERRHRQVRAVMAPDDR